MFRTAEPYSSFPKINRVIWNKAGKPASTPLPLNLEGIRGFFFQLFPL